MSLESFRTDASIAVPHGARCRCALHSRRLFTAGLVVGGGCAAGVGPG